MIPNRPKITDAETDKIVEFFFPEGLPALLVIGVRGYFLKSVGAADSNDINLYDDAVIVYEKGNLVKTFNGNTDPSKGKANLAMLDTGVYQFAKGRHKNRIDAFRAFPEGVRLKCKRQNSRGVWTESFCSAINFHDGGASGTWSAGCQTIINQGKQKQFNEFQDLVYSIMTKRRLKTFTYLLIDETQMQTAIEGKATDNVSVETPIEISLKNQKISTTSSAVITAEINRNLNIQETQPPAVAPVAEESEFSEPAQSEPTPNNSPALVEETVRETTQKDGKEVEKTTSQTTNTFTPANIPAFIPRFGKQWYLSLIPGGGLLATIAAKLSEMPDWLVFTLGFFTGVTTVLFFQLIIKHREKVLDFITTCYKATADPAMHNLIPTPAAEFVGFRRNELFSALIEKKENKNERSN